MAKKITSNYVHLMCHLTHYHFPFPTVGITANRDSIFENLGVSHSVNAKLQNRHFSKELQ